MLFVQIFKYLRFLLLLTLPFFAWLIPDAQKTTTADLPADKINLALRRTADALLRDVGDSTSRIPAIEQVGAGIWRIQLEQPFRYNRLPDLLQGSLALFGIRKPYDVTIRRCEDGTIDLGYRQFEQTQNGKPVCGERDMPEGCHYIELNFSENGGKKPFWAGTSWVLFLLWAALAGFLFFRKPRRQPPETLSGPETDWLSFGNSRLDVAGQVLICGGVRQALTFREAKLLRLFVTSPDRLLERDFILREVWADEGVLVGRSVDVFVSRLRKKLAADPSVGIAAVHGVGYRLETGKQD